MTPDQPAAPRSRPARPGTGRPAPRSGGAPRLREAARAKGKAASPARPRGTAGASRPPRRPSRGNALDALRGLQQRLRRAWDRPLTAYYLLLGGSLLILVLGLVMVYSASQIKALQSGSHRRTSSANSFSPPCSAAR
ncbi:hypothetical protein SANTM175S_04089 [Streptomyces antimycoticus]